VSADDQVKAYIKKIMSQLNRWMVGGKISKLVVVITDKETGEHVERWQFDVCSAVLVYCLCSSDGDCYTGRDFQVSKELKRPQSWR
jgi:HORMA domain.